MPRTVKKDMVEDKYGSGENAMPQPDFVCSWVSLTFPVTTGVWSSRQLGRIAVRAADDRPRGPPVTGPSSTLIPLPRNSLPIRTARSSINSRSKLAAAVKADGNCVTKSVYLGPAAEAQLPVSSPCRSSRPSLKHNPGMPSRGTPPELA